MSDHTATAPKRASNHLVGAHSPYLLQHAHNPVDWWPWRQEALDLARRQDKPIFLSVGYAACHWCHVMERESFANDAIAALLNQDFVSIKVDREEQPHVDEIYMLATQLLTGSGGWPMSVWLTPDLEPFYAGTYFPPVDRSGRPSFPEVLRAVAQAWKTQRAEVLAQAHRVTEALIAHSRSTSAPVVGDATGWLTEAIRDQLDRFDPQWGGWRGAPKFPPHQAVELWLACLENLSPLGPAPRPAWAALGGKPTAGSHASEPSAASAMASFSPAHSPGDVATDVRSALHPLLPDPGNSLAHLLTVTLERMAAGGIWDQLAGGFARYSTDERWLVPHFEKMLYDNALLAAVYARTGRRLANADFQCVARRTLDFVLETMATPDGLFGGSLDADSLGGEGRYYVWSWEQLQQVCDDTGDWNLLTLHYSLSPEGNWNGVHVLAIARAPAEIARVVGSDSAAIAGRLDILRQRLLAIRRQRVAPALDDKVLTGWNGLMVGALARSAAALVAPEYLAAANRAADALWSRNRHSDGEWCRVTRAAAATGAAYLEDYAYTLQGWLDLVEAQLALNWITSSAHTSAAGSVVPGWQERWDRTAEPVVQRRVAQARELADGMIARFHDVAAGGFFSAGAAHQPLLVRLKSAADNALPAPYAVAVHSLLRLGWLLGDERYRRIAMQALASVAPQVTPHPAQFCTLLTALVEDATRRG
jgi:uncharacterized protein YyaL (SSP411 family)